MNATPIDDNTSTVTLVGTLDSYQQYSDLMLALLRFPDAQSVGRNSYVSTDKIVPALTEVDQNGRPRGVNEAPVPAANQHLRIASERGVYRVACHVPAIHAVCG